MPRLTAPPAGSMINWYRRALGIAAPTCLEACRRAADRKANNTAFRIMASFGPRKTLRALAKAVPLSHLFGPAAEAKGGPLQ